MKICVISFNIVNYFQRDPERSGGFGGAEVQAAFLAKALSNAGQQVSLIVANKTSDLPYPSVNAFNSSDGLPVFRFFRPRLSGILSALEQADADVYYQRNAGMSTGIAAMFCRRNARVFVYGAGSDTDFSFWKVRLPNLRDRILFQRGLRLAHGVVVQNRFQEQICREKFNPSVRSFPNGIAANEERAQMDPDRIVWVGAIRDIKRPDLFVELAARLPDQKFVLIGGTFGGDSNTVERVRAAADKLPNIELTGSLPHAEVHEHLKRAYCLINTSTVEGFPNAYLEAWSLGVPVITFNDVDGLIETQKLGAVCRDVREMETAIRHLVGDPEGRASMGDAARAMVLERHSAPVLASAYIDFFQELVTEQSQV